MKYLFCLLYTSATITSGEKTDGKELPKLVQKSKAAGRQIGSVIGDMAHSEKKDIEAAKEGDYELIEKVLGIAADEVLVASTGVIGMQLPIDRICNGIDAMAVSYTHLNNERKIS